MVAGDSSTLNIKIHQLSSSNLFVQPKINGSYQYVQVDCGSQISTIPMHLLSVEQRKSIRRSDLILKAYGGSRVQNLGQIALSIELDKDMVIPDCEFVVVTSDSVPLLGNNILLAEDERLEIDPAENKIMIHGTEMELYYSETGESSKMNSVVVKTSDSVQKIVVKSQVELDPNSETMVMVKLELPPSTSNMMTEPQAAFRFINGRRFRLPIAKGLYSAHQFGEFAVRVANPYDKKILLEANSKLGSMRPVDGETMKVEQVHATTINSSSEDRVDKLMAEMDIGEVNEKQKRRLRSIIAKYQNTILLNDELPGVANVPVFRVFPKENTPIASQSYRTSYPLRPVLKRILKKQMEKGLIERSHSPWNSPTLLVQKPSGDYRMVIDYRKVNSAIKGDSYPLPRIPDLLVNLKGSQVFSALDLCSGYHQIPLAEDSREPLVMGNELGQFAWRVMPQGIKTAPNYFQRLMDQIFQDVPLSSMVIYLDDILCHAKDIDSNLDQLDECFKLLGEKNLQVKAEKAKLLHDQIIFCGHKIKQGRIHIPEKGVKAVLNLQRPRTKTQAQQCFGLVNYLRKSIPDFARIAKPITKTFGAGRFKWTPEADEALQKLKHLIANATQGLQIPDVNTDVFVVETDSSDTSMAGCLYVCSEKCPPGGAADWHEHDENCLKPVEFFSQNFTQSQAEKWFIRDKELMAYKRAIQKWRMYLLGRQFVWRTDNSCLSYANEARKTNPKVAKILAEVGEYDYIIQRRTSSQMKVSDALSRSISSLKVTIEDFGMLQKSDPTLNKIRGYVTIGKWPKQVTDPEILFWKKKSSSLELGTKGELVMKTDKGVKLLVPNGQRLRLIQSYHDEAGHPGLKNTFVPMSNHFTWYQMKQAVEDHVKTCEVCQKNKPNLQVKKPPQYKTDTPKQLFEKISVDLTGPLPRTNRNNRWILVANDHFSKRIHTRALTDKSAAKVLTAMKSIIYQEMARVPRNILTDNGLEFAGVFSDWLKQMGIKHSHSAPYAPTTNGLTERSNQSLKNRLKPKQNPKDWDELLLPITMQLNMCPHEVTKRSPLEIEFGLEGINPNVPFDISAKNLDNLIEIRQEVRKFIEDEKKSRSIKSDRYFTPFQIGDLVLMKSQPGSRERFIGPYKVVRVFAEGRSYEISDDEGVSYKRQCKDLKPFYMRSEAPENPVDQVQSTTQEITQSTETIDSAVTEPIVLYPNAGLGWPTVSLPRYTESTSNINIFVDDEVLVADEDIPVAAEVSVGESATSVEDSTSFYMAELFQSDYSITAADESEANESSSGDDVEVESHGGSIEEDFESVTGAEAGAEVSSLSSIAEQPPNNIDSGGMESNNSSQGDATLPEMHVEYGSDSSDSDVVMVAVHMADENKSVKVEPLDQGDITMTGPTVLDNPGVVVQPVPSSLVRSASVPMELGVDSEKKRPRSDSPSPVRGKRHRRNTEVVHKDHTCTNSFLEYTNYELTAKGVRDIVRSMDGYTKEGSIPITIVPDSYNLHDQEYFQLVTLALKWKCELRHYDLNSIVTMRNRLTSYCNYCEDIESRVVNGKKYYSYNSHG